MGGEMGRNWRGEAAVRIYSMRKKSIFNKKISKLKLTQTVSSTGDEVFKHPRL